MSIPANSINESTTGIVGFTGTGFTASPATQHCVQIGGATTSTLVSVTNGTTGQFLGANTAAAPTWQSIPASFAPNATVQLKDDFIGGINDGSGNLISELTWQKIGTNWNLVVTTENGHPGLLSSPGGSTAGSMFLSNALTYTFILGGGVIVVNWVFKIGTLSVGGTRYAFRCGIGGQTNGCYFEYSDNLNAGNWVFRTAKGGVQTTTNSATVATVGWHNAQITINANASSVNYTMDGVSLGNITTNIPIVAIPPQADFTMSDDMGGNSKVFLDLFYLTQTLTSPR